MKDSTLEGLRLTIALIAALFAVAAMIAISVSGVNVKCAAETAIHKGICLP